MIFQVIEKSTNKVFNVYAVKNDKNEFPQFLIHDGRAWKWQSAKLYKPTSIDVKEQIKTAKALRG